MNKLDDLLVAEIGKDAPDRNTVLEILGRIQDEDPVHNIPVKALKDWKELQAINAPKPKSIWKRIGNIAAVLAIVFLVLGVVPTALGMENMFQRIGRWTKDLLTFDDREEAPWTFETENPGLLELYNTMTGLGMQNNVVPTWLPAGYELDLINQTDTPVGARINAVYCNGLLNIRLTYQTGYGGDRMYQKNDADVEILEQNGNVIYIVENEEEFSAIWVSQDNIECALFVTHRQDIYEIIDSIYEKG